MHYDFPGHLTRSKTLRLSSLEPAQVMGVSPVFLLYTMVMDETHLVHCVKL